MYYGVVLKNRSWEDGLRHVWAASDAALYRWLSNQAVGRLVEHAFKCHNQPRELPHTVVTIKHDLRLYHCYGLQAGILRLQCGVWARVPIAPAWAVAPNFCSEVVQWSPLQRYAGMVEMWRRLVVEPELKGTSLV